jgi:GMP synthase (glutamine-hydrolysing)
MTTPSAPSVHSRLLILDFGSQYTQVIARRVREAGVYCEIVPFNKAEEALAKKPKAIILSGGPRSVYEDNSPRAPQSVFEAGVPVLGICYGEMTMSVQLGGKVETSNHREFGRAFVDITGDCGLFTGPWKVGAREQVWMSHGDRVTALPPGFKVVGVSEGAPFAAIANEEVGSSVTCYCQYIARKYQTTRSKEPTVASI